MLFARAAAPEAAFGHVAAAPGRAFGAGAAPCEAAFGAAPAPPRYPGLYHAGGYNHAERELDGHRVGVTALVRLPDPFGLGFRHSGDGRWFGLDGGTLEHYRHRLDLARGRTEREVLLRDPAGRRTRLHETRCVSLLHPELTLLRWQVTPLDRSGAVEVCARLQCRVRNAGVARARAYGGRELEILPIATAAGAEVLAVTTDGSVSFRIEARLRCRCRGATVESGVIAEPNDTALTQQCRIDVRAGEAFEVERVVTVRIDGEPSTLAETADASDRWLAEQATAWQALWRRAELAAPRDPELERRCRFNAFHLLQTASPLSASRDSALPARGWQEGYLGHIFWDELFAFPFYNLRLPQIARGLLNYRRRRLGAACTAARRIGRRGRCTRGAARPAARKRRRHFNGFRRRIAGGPTTRGCSITSARRSPSTCGSTTSRPATPSCCSAAPVRC